MLSAYISQSFLVSLNHLTRHAQVRIRYRVRLYACKLFAYLRVHTVCGYTKLLPCCRLYIHVQVPSLQYCTAARYSATSVYARLYIPFKISWATRTLGVPLKYLRVTVLEVLLKYLLVLLSYPRSTVEVPLQYSRSTAEVPFSSFTVPYRYRTFTVPYRYFCWLFFGAYCICTLT